MNRRTFFMAGVGACLGGPAALRAATDDPLARVDIYSRHLQWLRRPEEIAAAARGMGYTGVNLTVRPYPGHVDPARVKTDLPPFVKALRAGGVEVRAVTCPIADADSPHAEDIVGTLADLDIRHYWWGIFRYNTTDPIQAQLDALRPRIAGLARLNEKHNVGANYHLYAGSTEVGGSLWDLLLLLREHDPRYVGLDYDICHMSQAGDLGTWRVGLRAAGPYVRAVSLKDALTVRLPDGRWSVRYTPMGKGLVDMPAFIQILRQLNFAGPLNMQPEYENGGAQDAADTLTWPRKQVLGNMAGDLRTWQTAVAGPPPTRDDYLPDGVPFLTAPYAQMGGGSTNTTGAAHPSN